MDTQQPNIQQQYKDPELDSQIVAQTVTDETTEKHTWTDSTDHEKMAMENLYEDIASVLEIYELEKILSNINKAQYLESKGEVSQVIEIHKQVYKYFEQEALENPEEQLNSKIKNLILEYITQLEENVAQDPKVKEFIPFGFEVNRENINITGEGSNAYDEQDGH